MNVAIRSDGFINPLAEFDEVRQLFQKINDDPLIDRLYRRYVRRKDNAATLEVLKNKFVLLRQPILERMIEKLEDGIKGSELSLKTFGGEYFPIRLCMHDVFYSMVEEEIPLEDYDNLEGDPLWMRPEYMLEKYGNK